MLKNEIDAEKLDEILSEGSLKEYHRQFRKTNEERGDDDKFAAALKAGGGGFGPCGQPNGGAPAAAAPGGGGGKGGGKGKQGAPDPAVLRRSRFSVARTSHFS